MVKFIIKSLLNKAHFLNWNQDDYLKYFLSISNNKNKIKTILAKENTPIFIGDTKIIAQRHHDLKNALEKNWLNYQISYSFKTNYSIIENNYFKNNFWAEVVSAKEYLLAEKNQYKNIIFNGPLKTESSLKQAIKNNSIINLDHESEITKVAKHNNKTKTNFGLRLNIITDQTTQKSRFGFSIENKQAEKALKIAKINNVSISGLHIHLGTNIPNCKKYQQAAKKISDFIVKNKLTKQIRYIDFGGGFVSHANPPNDRLNWNIPDIEEYIQAITTTLKQVFHREKKPILLVEPGRYLVKDAISLFSRIENKKIENQTQLITTDTSINMLPITHYRKHIVQIAKENLNIKTGKKIKTIIYGATCQEDDILFEGYLPKISESDYLIWHATGAYNDSMNSNFIFDKPKTVFI